MSSGDKVHSSDSCGLVRVVAGKVRLQNLKKNLKRLSTNTQSHCMTKERRGKEATEPVLARWLGILKIPQLFVLKNCAERL